MDMKSATRLVTLLLLLLLLGGCQSATPVATVAPTSTLAPEPTIVPPSPAPTDVVVATATAPATPMPEPTSAATATAAPTPMTPLFPPEIALQHVATLPGEITSLSYAPGDTEHLFVTGKQGVIWVLEQGDVRRTPFLDISQIVDAGASERGLLSMAFDPGFQENGRFYLNYTSKEGDGDTVIARYESGQGLQADVDSGVELLRIDQPAANHNGGQLQFAPDGYLYIGMGDGGAAGDPWDNAENLSTLLGKMLRIRVSDVAGYAIPDDNPFVDGPDGARPEIWAYGLRNPWRFSFDRMTGDCYIADVGQNKWEEVDFEPAGSAGGLHYGWNTMEGSHCYDPPKNCDRSGKQLPIWEYAHPQGCSITGGYVYRGQRFPSLFGRYFFADFCNGAIYALHRHETGWEAQPVLETGMTIASFGEDATGELYVLDLGGDVYRLIIPE